MKGSSNRLYLTFHNEFSDSMSSSETNVTVILPVYNGSAYLREAIESVITQDCDDWKLLIVDDCSKDNSINIINKYNSSKLELKKNKSNLGLYGSLNKAIEGVNTDYCVILMQDDMLKPNHISSFLRFSKMHENCVSFWGDNDVIDSHGNYSSKGRVDGIQDYCAPSRKAWLDTFRRGCYWIISGSFNKTSWLKIHPFRSEFPHAADLNFLITTIHQKPMLYVGSTFSIVRIHDDQQTNRHVREARDLREYLIILREQYREGMTRLEFLRLRFYLQAAILRRIASRIKKNDMHAVRKTAILFLQSLRF
ncbi:MAG TPA: hypothetical protein DDY37_07520 [Legionella sp.]|nr:hypothetical protein [Legionella sp.]